MGVVQRCGNDHLLEYAEEFNFIARIYTHTLFNDSLHLHLNEYIILGLFWHGRAVLNLTLEILECGLKTSEREGERERVKMKGGGGKGQGKRRDEWYDALLLFLRWKVFLHFCIE